MRNYYVLRAVFYGIFGLALPSPCLLWLNYLLLACNGHFYERDIQC